MLGVALLYLWWNVAAATVVQPTGWLRQTVLVPAAFAHGKVISYASVGVIAEAIRKTEDGIGRYDAVERALAFQLNDAAVRQVLRQAGQQVPGADPSAPVDTNFVTRAEWSNEQYQRIVGGSLLRRQLAEEAVLRGESGRATAEGTLLPLRDQIRDGMPFAGAAEIFSEDASASKGGYLGTEPEDWMAPVMTIEPGEMTDVLAGPDAYWLLTRRSGAIYGIAVKKPTLDQILQQKANEQRPFVVVW